MSYCGGKKGDFKNGRRELDAQGRGQWQQQFNNTNK